MKTVLSTILFLILGSFLHAQVIRTIAGNGTASFAGDGGLAINATLNGGDRIATDYAGNIYVPDYARIRKISTNGIITTIAGTGIPGFSGDHGPALNAQIGIVPILTCDPAGNIYFVDETRVRKINRMGIITTIAGNGVLNGTMGNGGPALSASLGAIRGIAVDAAGNVFLADNLFDNIRKIDAATGTIYPYASAAGVSAPGGLHITQAGNLLVCDMGNRRLLSITPSGTISTIAGTRGVTGFSGDGLPATAAFFGPFMPSVVSDASGNIYISDHSNNRIRMINRSGIITTIAGNGSAMVSGDGWRPTCAGVIPWDLAILPNEDLLLADLSSLRVRRIFKDSTTPLQPGPISGSTTFCAGVRLTYSVDSIPGISVYEWFLPPGWTGFSTGRSITVIASSTGGTVSVHFSSSCGLSPASSIAVTPGNIIPAVHINAVTNGLCSGTVGASLFVATSTNGGNAPIYHWKKNGLAVGNNASYYADNMPNTGDVITVTLTSNAPCAAPSSVVSNALNMTGGTSVIPGINVNSHSPSGICEGEPIQFYTNSTGGGISPQYQWYKNGTLIAGANSSYFTDTSPANQDTLSVVLTSSEACAVPSEARSNKIGVQVAAMQHPTISITATPTVIVANGQPATFTAHYSGGGTTPGLQWYKNGVAILGATDSIYTTSNLNGGDEVAAELISTALCAFPPQLMSGAITVQQSTGVSSVENDFWAVYPNPCNGNFNLSLGSTVNGQVLLELLNGLGQNIYRKYIAFGTKAHPVHIELPESIAAGIYYLKLTTEERVLPVKPLRIAR